MDPKDESQVDGEGRALNEGLEAMAITENFERLYGTPRPWWFSWFGWRLRGRRYHNQLSIFTDGWRAAERALVERMELLKE